MNDVHDARRVDRSIDLLLHASQPTGGTSRSGIRNDLLPMYRQMLWRIASCIQCVE